MDTLSLLRGLRFVDSFYPSGGFAFSSGLEAAVHDGAVCDAKELARYVEDLLVNGLSRREAVAVSVAHRAVASGTIETAMQVDRKLDAMKIGRESRLASRQMGRQVIRGTGEQLSECRVLSEFRAAVAEGRTPGHFPVAIGMTLAACGWSGQEAVAAYLYQTVLGYLSATMKLLPFGQQEGQRLLEQWTPLLADLSRAVETQAEMVSWSPIQDVYAMRHARLESRLFRS